MKKALLILIFSLFCNLCFGQLEQNLSIRQALELFEMNQKAVDKYLKANGYQLRNRSGNFYTYLKSSSVSSYNFTVSYRNDKVSGLTWDEFVEHYSVISNELSNLGFKLSTTVNYEGREMRGFENIQHNLLTTLTVKGTYFSVVLGVKNPNKPMSSLKSAAKTNARSGKGLVNVGDKRIGAVKSSNLVVKLPQAPFENSNLAIKSGNFRSINGIQKGIIQKIFKGADDENWITICFKDALNEIPFKGYVLMDVSTAEYFKSDGSIEGLSKKNAGLFKKIAVPGRRVEFQTEFLGSGILGFSTLVYIKSLPNSSLNFGTDIRVEKHFLGGIDR